MAIELDDKEIKRLGYIEPPGCMHDILSHPFDSDKTIEVALFSEHRFAFYYWLKWANDKDYGIPSLISYDWHQDLMSPYDDQLPELKNLDTENKGEVALYTWAKLSHQNDVQIKAAIMVNKIKDVYVICRQDAGRKSKETITDFYGNKHVIHIFKNPADFDAYLPKIKDEWVFFDIDLDYFTFSNPTSMKGPVNGKHYTYMKKNDALNLFSIENATVQWILKRLAGMTIAMEPEFCGGLKKSNYYLKILEDCYFEPSLFLKQLSFQGTSWRQEVTEILQTGKNVIGLP